MTLLGVVNANTVQIRRTLRESTTVSLFQYFLRILQELAIQLHRSRCPQEHGVFEQYCRKRGPYFSACFSKLPSKPIDGSSCA